MELALAYAVRDAQRRKDIRKENNLIGIQPDWRAFHESEGHHKISVFAGRRMGKTYNLALRAFNSEYDCEIFTSNISEVAALVQLINDMAIEQGINVVRRENGGRSVLITLGDLRTIAIFYMRNVSNGMRGRRWRGKEIFFSEFDHSDFEDIMTAMNFEISQAMRIFCVGSITRAEDNFAKRWFKESDLQYFIDDEFPPPDRGHMSWEHRPSVLRSLIENAPPLSVDFS